MAVVEPRSVVVRSYPSPRNVATWLARSGCAGTHLTRTAFKSLAAIAFLVGGLSVPAQAQDFVDVTSAPLDSTATGIAWGDYDGDGDPDLYVTKTGTNSLYRNEGGGVFVDVTSGPLVDLSDGFSSVWGDYDNDGDLDLYLARQGAANKLLRNDGSGAFADVTSGPLGDMSAIGVAWGDYDNDGDLDLYLGGANKLLRNEGGGGFVDATSTPLDGAGVAWDGTWVDYDNDGDLDLYLLICTANRLFRNESGGVFADLGPNPLGETTCSAGVAVGDYDNDGDLDFWLTGFFESSGTLYRNDGSETFTSVSTGLGGTGIAIGPCLSWGDYDNDGDLDLYAANDEWGVGRPNNMLRNDGGDTFVDVAGGLPLADSGVAQGAAYADFDGDGDLDLYLTNRLGGDAASKLLRNEVGNQNHWLHVKLEGTVSNKSGIGARVRIVVGGQSQIREVSARTQYSSQNSLTSEFGLGASTSVDSVIVTWPSGQVSSTVSVSADQVISLVEPPPPPSQDFVDVTIAPLDSPAQGVAWGDYDGDGDPDLYITRSASNSLYRNEGSGVFVDVTSGSLVDPSDGSGSVWGDYDNDGDLDLYISNPFDGNKLLRNDGGSAFADVTTGPLGVTNVFTSAWGDYDNDGDLDLYLVAQAATNKLLRNEGGGVFVDATSAPLDDGGAGIGGTWVDYDNDGDLDFFLVNIGPQNKLFRNEGGGLFADLGTNPLGETISSGGVAVGDYDNDGDLDFWLTGFGTTTSGKLYRNDGSGAFVQVTTGLGTEVATYPSLSWGDYDNDGDLDLYAANGHFPNNLLRNDGGDTFVDVAGGLPLGDSGAAEGAAFADYDSDGDLDLYLANSNSASKLLRNEVGNLNHWLHVKLEGTVSNRSGIGARVRIVVGGQSQVREVSGSLGYSSQNSLTSEFGLGASTSVDSVVVTWPSGLVDARGPFSADQVITLVEPIPPFSDVTNGPLGDASPSGGVAWGDYDGDGDLDMYVSNLVTSALLRNDGGDTFADATSSPVDVVGGGAAWGDYDNDGDLDFYLAKAGANQLFENTGGGGFTDVTSGPLGDAGSGTNVTWADYDNDGDLDLYVANTDGANKLLRNDAGGSFSDATGPLGDPGDGSGLAWGDYDDDGDLDLYVANAADGPNKLFRNDGGGAFADVTSSPLDDATGSFGAAWGDYDNDGDLDLYLAKAAGQANKLFRNDGAGAFVNVAGGSPVADTGDGIGVAWGDYDNDGDLDLYVANSAGANKLFRNEGGAAFIDATVSPLDDESTAGAVAWGDYDCDGDVDLYLANLIGANKLLRNELDSENHWIQIKLVGTLSNRSAIGARVRIEAGGQSQIREVSGGSGIRSQNSLEVEFGLGTATSVDSIVVIWPSGIVQALVSQGVDQKLTIIESTGDEFVDATFPPLGDTGTGESVAWGDYDGDGDLDLYITNFNSANKLLRNEGGATFADATSAPLDDVGAGRTAIWGDADNDGDLDLFLANSGSANRLFVNDAGTFTDAANGDVADGGSAAGAAWGDFDNDGDLDLYLARQGAANKLFRNEGCLVFVDITTSPLDDAGTGRGVAWGDFDDDGDLDLYLANGGANRLFRNDGDEVFVDVTSGPLGDAGSGAGVAWGDYDNDSDLDLYLSNVGTANKLLRNEGGGVFVDDTGTLGDSGSGTGVAWADIDHDGDLDLYLANEASQANKMFRNEGGSFVDVTLPPLDNASSGRGVAFGDYDGDGDADLYLVNQNAANKMFANPGGGGNHWLRVNLEGVVSNASAIGARVELTAGGVTQIREISGGSGLYSQNALIANFGLGVETTITSLVVQWPSGIVQTVSPAPAVDTTVAIVEDLTQGFSYVDVTTPPLDDLKIGRGAAWGDYDADGDLDLYLTNQEAQDFLFRNDGDDVFVDVTSGDLVEANVLDETQVAKWGDYDDDGDMDLYLVNRNQANKLFRNDGSDVFVDVTTAPMDDGADGQDMAWGDYDQDGDLDVYIGQFNHGNLIRNDGAGVFVDVTSTTPMTGSDGRAHGVLWVDYDNDGDVDLHLVKFGQTDMLVRNDGGGNFVDVTAGPVGDGANGIGAAWGDYDNDGDLDYYLCVNGQDKLLRNDGGAMFADVTQALMLDGLQITDGGSWGDFDHDGDLDLYLTNLNRVNELLRNDAGTFVDVGAVVGGNLVVNDQGNGYCGVFGDYDCDGDLDIYMTNRNPSLRTNRLFRNEHGSQGHWVQVKLVGIQSSTFAIGARVEMWAGGAKQIRPVTGDTGPRAQAPFAVHFGLGSTAKIDSIVVRWPTGLVQTVVDPCVDTKITIHEGGVVSTPVTPTPTHAYLHAAMPNPFSGRTVLRFELPRRERVMMTVHDVAGRRVRTVVPRTEFGAGAYSIDWDGRSDQGRRVGPGVYFYRLEAGSFVETRRMVLIR